MRRAEVALAHHDDLVCDDLGWALVVHGKGGKQQTSPDRAGKASWAIIRRMRPGEIGVAISTMNRFPMFRDTVKHWAEHTPPEIPIIVVDDASDVSASDQLEGWRGIDIVRLHQITSSSIRHTYRRGIAMTKNRCITELVDWGCEHLFLADDDVYPLVDEWWVPYVESPEQHLAYQWGNRMLRSPWRMTHDDGRHFSIGFPRGVLLYATREAVATVGGMDPAYGVHGGEHVDWSNRIHDAGLTTWPYADVCGSEDIWWAHDRMDNTNNSTTPLPDRIRMCRANGVQWNKVRPSPYVEYREGVRVQDYSLGVKLSDKFSGTLKHVLGLKPSGVALEFGVGAGHSLRRIAEHMPAVGFDSFAGLPEDWREGFPAGMFAQDYVPTVRNAIIVAGLFTETLPEFDWDSVGHVGLVHFDADLYSSTATALEHMGHLLVPGTYVVFDEAHGYPGWEDHEWKAWREFADRAGIGWTVVGHGPEQWAVRII